MMGVKLRLREPLVTWLDLSPLSALADANTGVVSGAVGEDAARSVAAVALPYGRGAVRADVLFAVSPCKAPGLTLCGDLTLGANLGQGLAAGTIRAEGNAGPNLGRLMTGGEITVCGDVGENAFEDMQNGFGVVLGAARGGACRRMRRGTVVLGAAGGPLGAAMRGGTLLVQSLLHLGAQGEATKLGMGMDRGTIILTEGFLEPMGGAATMRTGREDAGVPLPGFSAAAQTSLPFLRLVFRMLRQRGAPVCETDGDGALIRLRGDSSALGKGELFVPAEPRA